MLMERFPHVDRVRQFEIRQFKYYHVRYANIRISVDPVSSGGDPDLYISTVPNPGPQNYNWSSFHFGRDEIHILKTDKAYLNNSDYYIGVRGFQPCNFRLLAISEGGRILR
jgi:hypothetical protein